MKPSGKTKKFLKILGGFLVLLLIGAVYLYFQFFADIDSGVGVSPNNIDSGEATRKLEIFRKALDVNRKGYIRLTEGEINSELYKFYSSKNDQKKVSLPDLSKCRVILDEGDVIILCWVRIDFIQGEKQIIWRRRFEILPSNTEGRLSLVSMYIGQIQLPEVLFPKVNQWLGNVDKSLRQNFAWALELPRIEISIVDESAEEELKIFTYYPETTPSDG